MLVAEAEADAIAQEARDAYLRQRKDLIESGLSQEDYQVSRLEEEQAAMYDPQEGMEDDFRN